MVVRLHAMYQRSRKMLIFLVVTFTAVTVTQGVNSARGISSMVGSKLQSWIKDVTSCSCD